MSHPRLRYPDLAVKFDLSEDARRDMPATVPLLLLLLMPSYYPMNPNVSDSNQCASPTETIVAAHTKSPISLDAAHPAPEWSQATPVSFCTDWQGKNPSAERMTVVRILWTRENLYIRFECNYKELTVFPDSGANGRRDHLWNRDVAETFLQPDPTREKFYKEFEVSPNGVWIDLDIGTGELVDLKSGLHRSVSVNEKEKRWTAELEIPMKALTENFDPKKEWRANFFRVEGPTEPRHYYAWRPTHTPQPNFHVPQAFGRIQFAE